MRKKTAKSKPLKKSLKTRKRKVKPVNEKICSPFDSKKHNENNKFVSCFSKEALNNIIISYNSHNSDNIKTNPEKNYSKKQLWSLINKS